MSEQWSVVATVPLNVAVRVTADSAEQAARLAAERGPTALCGGCTGHGQDWEVDVDFADGTVVSARRVRS